MPLYRLGDAVPQSHPSAWVADSATLIGRVSLGPGASVWYGAVLRAERYRNERIRVGMTDELHKFIFEGLPVRGMSVRRGPSWPEAMRRRELQGTYPASVRAVLGEMADDALTRCACSKPAISHPCRCERSSSSQATAAPTAMPKPLLQAAPTRPPKMTAITTGMCISPHREPWPSLLRVMGRRATVPSGPATAACRIRAQSAR